MRVTLIDSTKQHPISLQGKLEGVSHLNNFHYGEECLTAWKAFDVGEGKAIPWSQLQGKNISCLLLLSSHHLPPFFFRAMPDGARLKRAASRCILGLLVM